MRWALVLFLATVAHADPPSGAVEASLHVFAEPAPSQSVVIVTPSVSGRVDLKKRISLSVDWTSDVVTGATPRTYGKPDVVTSATHFSEVRNQVGARAEVSAGPWKGYAGYHFGIENDYRSHTLALGSTVDLFQRNTTLALDYAHSFDSVCDLDNGNLPVTLRQPLTVSDKCFSGAPGLTEHPIAIDDLALTITQVFSRRIIGSLSGAWQRVDGFQSNPYRRVALDGDALFAQESHPHLRDRGSLAARLRFSLPRLTRAALGVDLRYYGDTWGVNSFTADVGFDKEHFEGKLRWRAHVRYYQQSGAVFYRDAGNSNSYENAGPAGQYFTGDRELAPLADLVIGGALGYHAVAAEGKRLGKLFHALDVSLDLDLAKVFALTPEPPNHARMTGVVDAIAAGLSFLGEL